ncbi:MAG TPA: glutamate--tRNA ligase [Deltaproteobacteria bacterium]|nr:glutamate--tRNA ligase [Deltaproteobacteria bacterium]
MAPAPTRTRFAPSPTGSLHVGSVRTALYCLLAAHRTGGHFLLRIEDTDRARSTEESAQGILADLRWLGLEWDEGPGIEAETGPFFQSERLELYQAHVQQLLDRGLAYRAWETPEELAQMRRESERSKQSFRYRRRDYAPEELARFEAEGRVPTIRFRSPGHDVTIADRVQGEVSQSADELEDFVIVKGDGWPTYQLAVVIDDHHMGVDLVLRGVEHLQNTHKHLQLYEAFGWDPPEHGHLPLIFNPNGSKMSKRDKGKAAREAVRQVAREEGHAAGEHGWLAERTGLAVAVLDSFMAKQSDAVSVSEQIAEALGVELPMIDVLDFREAGYLPEALINYMALLGWNPGDEREILSLDELIEAFSLDRVNKTPARFNADKLAWVNSQYMQALPIEVLMVRLGQWLEVASSPMSGLRPADQQALIEMYRPRAKTFRDIDQLGAFFFEAPTGWAPKQVKKHLDKGGGWDRLEQTRAALGDVGRWEAPSLHKAFDALCEATGVGLGKYAQPVRIAVTGTGVSPEIFQTLAFLGRDETFARIDRCLAARISEPPA